MTELEQHRAQRFPPLSATNSYEYGVVYTALSVTARPILDPTGSIHCWGGNSVGQLGNGTTLSSSIPVTVVGRQSRATALEREWPIPQASRNTSA